MYKLCTTCFFLLHLKQGYILSPVWEDFTWWASEAWFRATKPLLGGFLKSSPPKLNFSSAFCQTRRRSICMVQIWHLLDCFLRLYQWDTLSTQEAKKGWFLTCCGSSKAKPRSLPGRKKKQWSNKRKKGERYMSNFAINHQLHMYYITTTIGIIKLSSVKYWDSTIFREGNLALVQIQVASNGVMHGKLLQRGQTTKRITFTL